LSGKILDKSFRAQKTIF